MIENNLRLRLIDFRIDVGESENASLHRFGLNLFREFKDALGVGGRSNDKGDGETFTAGKCRRHNGKHLNAGDLPESCHYSRQIRRGRGLRTPHGFKTIPPKPPLGFVI